MEKKNKNAKKVIVFVLKIIVFIFLCVFYARLISFFGHYTDSITFGEYKYIGIIILVTVCVGFIVSLAFALFKKSSKTKKIVTSLICAALIVLVIPIVNLAERICAIPYTEFSTEGWNNSTTDNLRQYMIPDLEEKYKIVGMRLEDVYSLIGEGTEETSTDGSHEITYDIGTFGVWHNTYVLEYDKNGIVTKTYTRPK
ncbi:MAG TPA: hypothetical protein DCS04_00405 [Ruminococcaceae bacterium]|nr:hypothetical protein [Oscillospiraceae bacterium]